MKMYDVVFLLCIVLEKIRLIILVSERFRSGVSKDLSVEILP